MKKLTLDQIQKLKGGICTTFPDPNHPGADEFSCFNVWLCAMSNQVTGGGFSCLLD